MTHNLAYCISQGGISNKVFEKPGTNRPYFVYHPISSEDGTMFIDYGNKRERVPLIEHLNDVWNEDVTLDEVRLKAGAQTPPSRTEPLRAEKKGGPFDPNPSKKD